jgi:hypothetical protein
VLDQAESEPWLGPVVAPLEDLQHVAIELHLTIEVLLLEGLDGDLLLAIVCIAVLGLVELEVVFNGLAGQLGLLVHAGGEFRREPPEGAQNGEEQDKSEENPCLEAHAPAPCDVGGDTDEQRDEERVVERLATRALGGQRGIGNGRVLLVRSCQRAGSPCCVSMAGGVLVYYFVS